MVGLRKPTFIIDIQYSYLKSALVSAVHIYSNLGSYLFT